MIKQSKIRRKSVDLNPPARPSRIRREPPPQEGKVHSLVGRINWHSREWEIRLALVGILFFAIAISAAVLDFGEALSH